MNTKNRKIAVIGGDKRQVCAIRELRDMGYTVEAVGFDSEDEGEEKTLDEALSSASALLLPIPVLRDGKLNMAFTKKKIGIDEILSRSENIPLICGGMFPDGYENESGGRIFDLCRDESFNIRNAVPTAEGALAVMMENTDFTVNGSRTAVVGYGRIGKALCRILRSLGSEVTAVSRSEKDLAASELAGCRAVDYGGFLGCVTDQQVIFNTVPFRVITAEYLTKMKKGTPIVELASKPGGVDCYEAACLGIRVISAQSLPGKTAPETAGKIIAHRLDKKLKEAEK